ncbi:unnamed protein product [Blepharisma stoltei]|uniref:Uncharacterized protein n=1 Tax=Blepharisma stoltei TaxID=1481888 RepID=A0AAU9JW83_9CILI|nr:unnamed protein product [Blepharisma stoltei]
MSLENDCAWKSLSSIAIRNLPGQPSELSLKLSNREKDFHLELLHPISLNPYWTSLKIPHKVYPVLVIVTNSSNSVLLEDYLNPKHLVFLTKDLISLKEFSFPFICYEFSDENWYAQQESIQQFTRATRKESLSLSPLRSSIRKDSFNAAVDFFELKENYKKLLRARKEFINLDQKTQELKASFSKILQSKTFKLQRLKEKKDLAEEENDFKRSIAEQALLTEKSHNLIKDYFGHEQVGKKLLHAHSRKFKERIESIDEWLMKVEAKQALVQLRRIKMIGEIYVAFPDLFSIEWLEMIDDEGNANESETENLEKLGYISHIIQTIAEIYRTQMRFQIIFKGSQSSVIANEEELPIYVPNRNNNGKKTNIATQCLRNNLLQIKELVPPTSALDNED